MLNNGFVGMLFDFNRDGKLDGFEQADVFAAFMSVMEDSVSSNREDMTVRRTLLRTQARTPPHKKAWLRKKNVLFKSSWKACCQM